MSITKTRSNKRKRVLFFETDKRRLVIHGKKRFGNHGEQVIDLEIFGEFIMLSIKNYSFEMPDRSELFIYAFSRKNRTIWAGNTLGGQGINGRILYRCEDEYGCALNSITDYLGELLRIRQSPDLQIPEKEEIIYNIVEIPNLENIFSKLER